MRITNVFVSLALPLLLLGACGKEKANRASLGKKTTPDLRTYQVVEKTRVGTPVLAGQTAVQETGSGYVGYVSAEEAEAKVLWVTLTETSRAVGDKLSSFVIPVGTTRPAGLNLTELLTHSEARADKNPWLLEQAKKRLPATKTTLQEPLRLASFHASALTLKSPEGKSLPRPKEAPRRPRLAD